LRISGKARWGTCSRASRTASPISVPPACGNAASSSSVRYPCLMRNVRDLIQMRASGASSVSLTREYMVWTSGHQRGPSCASTMSSAAETSPVGGPELALAVADEADQGPRLPGGPQRPGIGEAPKAGKELGGFGRTGTLESGRQGAHLSVHRALP